jgi:DNA-binding FadR family transcriptional regulator
MAQLARRGVHGQTVEIIARRILSGNTGEGETLDLKALQNELDVSLTALREALKVLSAKGIVDARQKRGTFVRPRADWNLLDGEVIRWQLVDCQNMEILDNLHELREIMEPAAARLAAERATDGDIAELERAVARMAAARTRYSAVNADICFHRAMLAASGNELLKRLEVAVEVDITERAPAPEGPTAHDAARRHYAVLAAIRAGDPEGAERAMLNILEYLEKPDACPLPPAGRDRRDDWSTGQPHLPGQADQVRRVIEPRHTKPAEAGLLAKGSAPSAACSTIPARTSPLPRRPASPATQSLRPDRC